MKYLNEILIEWNDSDIPNNSDNILNSDTLSELISNKFYNLLDIVFNISKDAFFAELKNSVKMDPNIYNSDDTKNDKDIIYQWKKFLQIIWDKEMDSKEVFNKFISILEDFYRVLFRETGKRMMGWIDKDAMIADIFEHIWSPINKKYQLESNSKFLRDYKIWHFLFYPMLLYSETFGIIEECEWGMGLSFKKGYQLNTLKCFSLWQRIQTFKQHY